MRESIKVNTKGETDVKSDETILYKPNFFDAREADVVRPGQKEIEWDDLLLMGETNKKETEYIGPDSEEAETAVKKARDQLIGRKLKLLNLVPVETVNSKAA